MDIHLNEQILDAMEQALSEGKTPAFSYDRVSTEEQATSGQSLSYQADNALLYAERNNLAIIHNFSCTESAFKEGRKNFNKMLDLALKFDVRHIIFKNTDRLGRNDVDWPRCKKLARQMNFNIHLYELGTVFHEKSTAEEELFLDNTAAMAAYWSRKISQGVKSSYQYRIQNGRAPYPHPPMGYKFDKESRQFIIDETKKQFIEYVFDTFDNNNISLNTLAQDLNTRGYRTVRGNKWNKTTLSRLLRSPFYAGYFEYKGDIMKGSHPSYFSFKDYQDRLIRMDSKAYGPSGKDFLFKGMLINAETGRALSGEKKHGAHKSGTYIYYSHPRPYKSIREETLFDLLEKEVTAIQFSETFSEYLKDLFRESVGVKTKSQAKALEHISKEIQKLENEQNKLLNLLIEGIDRNAVKRRMNDNRQMIEKLENDRQRMRVDKQKFIFHVSDTIDRIREFPKLYLNANSKQKVKLLKKSVHSIYVNGDSVELMWKKPMAFILNREVLSHFPAWVRNCNVMGG